MTPHINLQLAVALALAGLLLAIWDAALRAVRPPEPPPPIVTFPFEPPGALLAGSGTGATDVTVWSPDMRFPLEEAEAYANSQVWGVGGLNGPPGAGQCDARNYSYPWRDNFCETRDRANIYCFNGRGHQGQDIRPKTCEKSKHWAVAAENGRITAIGSFSVTLTADSGRIYRYLHLDMAQLPVKEEDRVLAGARIGLVSNDFGGTPTTIHLHFEIRMAIVTPEGQATIAFVPPYTSLVAAYARLLNDPPRLADAAPPVPEC